ncbi:sugar phosphate nucleotidyltransferase [Photobacterium sp. DNB23_23_1]
MEAIVLAAGSGSRIWPFNEIRSKALLMISNQPVLYWAIHALKEAGISKVTVLGDSHEPQIKRFLADTFDGDTSLDVAFFSCQHSKGAIDLLTTYSEACPIQETVLVIYGDCIIHRDDIKRLMVESTHRNCVLTRSLRDEECSDRIAYNKALDYHMLVHPRRDSYSHEAIAFKLSQDYFTDILPYTIECYEHTQVGMMPSAEKFIEASIEDLRKTTTVQFIECTYPSFNIDYPWNILEANAFINTERCSALESSCFSQEATIADSAILRGHVSVGGNTHIGDHVIFQGNAIIGQGCYVSDGAIIGDNVVIGDGATVKEHCKISSHSTIGSQSIVGHCAEFEGVMFHNTYLYHYCEVYGVLGNSVDIGAGTTFGTLRFDDRKTQHQINRKQLTPSQHGNAIFIGDMSRTGVNAAIMPGTKVGCRSIVGAGVVLKKDLSSNCIIQIHQEHNIAPWGSEYYGFSPRD